MMDEIKRLQAAGKPAEEIEFAIEQMKQAAQLAVIQNRPQPSMAMPVPEFDMGFHNPYIFIKG